MNGEKQEKLSKQISLFLWYSLFASTLAKTWLIFNAKFKCRLALCYSMVEVTGKIKQLNLNLWRDFCGYKQVSTLSTLV